MGNLFLGGRRIESSRVGAVGRYGAKAVSAITGILVPGDWGPGSPGAQQPIVSCRVYAYYRVHTLYSS